MSNMGLSLTDIAQELKDKNKKIQLIYAFNGTGKTRLSQEFKLLIEGNVDSKELRSRKEIMDNKFFYYNAFTEDLFHWDNDLEDGIDRKLKIYPNLFTNWIFQVQGQENNIARKFKKYTDSALTPILNSDFTETVFSYARGNDEVISNIKISKGEESNYIWCIFFTLLEEIIEILEENSEDDTEIIKTEQLKYIFIDDPVTSLDDNHLINLAVDLVQLIKKSTKLDIKFIITTHNPLFYNILLSELNNNDNDRNYKHHRDFCKYRLDKLDDGTFELPLQSNKSPFSYHMFLIDEIQKAIKTEELKKYHFNFLRNIYEKTAIFLGYESYYELLPKTSDGKPDPYANRVINLNSHSKHSGDEVADLSRDEKEGVKRIFNHLMSNHNFWNEVQR